MQRVLLQTILFLLVCTAFAIGADRHRQNSGNSKRRHGRSSSGRFSFNHTYSNFAAVRHHRRQKSDSSSFPLCRSAPTRLRSRRPAWRSGRANWCCRWASRRSINPNLTVAGTATQVTVAGDVTPLVTTTSPTLANIVERERIEQLPVNGRFVQNLIYMTTPGLESAGGQRVFGIRNGFELLQDGAVLENRQWQTIPARPPSLDTIEEFRAETSNSSAKMNRPGTVILTTRAGTNSIHGSLFETHRNSGFGVARARQDFFAKPPHLVRNEFGGSVGGPVCLPKLYNGKNRTFFFFAYEGYKLRQATYTFDDNATAEMREGDFSDLMDAQGRRFTIYDPLTTGANWSRQPFPNNRIPVDRRSPLATYLYSVTPLPTNPNVNPLVGPNWFGLGFDSTNQTTITTRIDQRVSDKSQLFFRYSHNPAFRRFTSSLGTGANASSPTTLDGKGNGALDDQANDSGVVSWTYTVLADVFQRDHRQRPARLSRTSPDRTGRYRVTTGPAESIRRPWIPAYSGHRLRNGLRLERESEYRLQLDLRVSTRTSRRSTGVTSSSLAADGATSQWMCFRTSR